LDKQPRTHKDNIQKRKNVSDDIEKSPMEWNGSDKVNKKIISDDPSIHELIRRSRQTNFLGNIRQTISKHLLISHQTNTEECTYKMIHVPSTRQTNHYVKEVSILNLYIVIMFCDIALMFSNLIWYL